MKYSLAGGDALARAVENAYTKGGTDYSLAPLNLYNEEKPIGLIRQSDAVIFCCRRGERETELTDAFTDRHFAGFEREIIDPLDFVILTMYSEKYTYLPIAFAPSKVESTLAKTLSLAGKKQLHISESEKFAHVTFFFNGGEQTPPEGEDDVRIPSPKGVAFDTVPELSLKEVADGVCEGLDKGYDFIVTNFANGDVIGHTANDAAKHKAAAAVDASLGKVLAYARERGYTVLVTADHGNIEIMRKDDGKPHVSHTTNPVACVAVCEGAKRIKEAGKLCDVAPTVLAAMGLEKPEAMSGQPLFSFPCASKTLLIILDGWGLGDSTENDPIYASPTPTWDLLIANTDSYAVLEASGPAVGLAEGKTGNSEAGHINIGSGRVVLQDDVRLDNAMNDGSFANNEVFKKTLEGVKERGSALHLIALLTKKSSHGSIDYPLALIDMAREAGLKEVYVHVIFDGRSTDPGSAPALLREFGAMLCDKGAGLIVSGIGRGVALDRDQNWGKVQTAYKSLTEGVGEKYCEKA